MAVAPTGAIYKSLIFDKEDSRDYGVYITGEAVYNAPERDVEMIAIPGRNGAFALDKGRFENIEVSYPAGIFADNETDFAEAISDFRNFLCSRKGYVRLEDEYNPNEYRMAVYKSGLEVSPTQLMTGEFEIIFECKPQRWLKSGEDAVTMPGKNLIPYPYYHTSGRVNRGITFTVSNDGAVHMSGIGEASTLQPFFSLTNNLEYLYSDTEYIMSQDTTTDKSFIAIYFKDDQGQDVSVPFSATYDDGTVYNATRNYIRLLYSSNTHKWCKFKFTSDDPVYIQTDVRIIENAGSLEGVVKPMIRLATDTDPNYVRYNGIYNPTLFDARSMLEVYGYGDVNIGSDKITVNNIAIGYIELLAYQKTSKTASTSLYEVERTFDTSLLNNGDAIFMADAKANVSYNSNPSYTNLSATISGTNGATATCTSTGKSVTIILSENDLQFVYGTPKTVTGTATLHVSYTYNGSSSSTNKTLTLKAVYNGSNKITVSINVSAGSPYQSQAQRTVSYPVTAATSTKSALGTPTYIDLDIGEAWKEESGVVVSLDNTVEIPAELPTLAPGANAISYDNTVTQLDIVPRWWKV